MLVAVLTALLYDRFMTSHTEDALCGSRITQVLDLFFTVAATETTSTECLVACENCQIFYLVSTGVAAICAVIADKGAVAEE